MALPSSGPLKFSDINIELGNILDNQISLGSAPVRTLYGVSTGAIRLAADGYGKSSTFKFNITTNTTNANLRTLAVNAGWDQTTAVEATVNTGVYVYSTSTGTPALTINGTWPGGVKLINNGYIIGMGGAGGGTNVKISGEAGGPAISLGINCTIQNNSYIAGGGGGGRSGSGFAGGGGGGAGGGRGGNSLNNGLAGGAGGGPGASGSNGVANYAAASLGGGGGGGRILPGTGGAGGTGSTKSGWGGGAGGGGGCSSDDPACGGINAGGTGGGSNSAGAAGANACSAGGGGGWGAAGGRGGAGGKAVNLNGYTITWTATGTRWGAIS